MTKTVSHLIIAAALAGLAAASLKATPSMVSAPVLSALLVKAEAVPSGALFFLLPPASNRFAAATAGLEPSHGRILRLAPYAAVQLGKPEKAI